MPTQAPTAMQRSAPSPERDRRDGRSAQPSGGPRGLRAAVQDGPLRERSCSPSTSLRCRSVWTASTGRWSSCRLRRRVSSGCYWRCGETSPQPQAKTTARSCASWCRRALQVAEVEHRGHAERVPDHLGRGPDGFRWFRDECPSRARNGVQCANREDLCGAAAGACNWDCVKAA